MNNYQIIVIIVIAVVGVSSLIYMDKMEKENPIAKLWGGESKSGINCNDEYDKFLCFGNAFDSCTIAVFSHVMITDEGYPITVEAYVTDECKIHVTNDNRDDMSTDPIDRELLEGQCNELQITDDFMDIEQCVFGENYSGSVRVWNNNNNSRISELEELSSLVNMNCDEIVDDTYNREEDYESSDNRGFARDKIRECTFKQKRIVMESDCMDIFTMIKDPMDFYVEGTQSLLDMKARKCQADPAEIELYQKFEECISKSDWVSFSPDTGVCTLQE